MGKTYDITLDLGKNDVTAHLAILYIGEYEKNIFNIKVVKLFVMDETEHGKIFAI